MVFFCFVIHALIYVDVISVCLLQGLQQFYTILNKSAISYQRYTDFHGKMKLYRFMIRRMSLMEFTILYSIPRSEVLDSFFLGISSLIGSYGQLFLILGFLLMIPRNTRKTGMAVIIAFLGVLLFGQLLLKHLVNRPRPCQIDTAFALLVTRPTSASFPSTHSSWAFGAATAVFLKYRKFGAALFIFASIVAFSRMYLFLHFPTDVLFGIIMGIILGTASVKLSDKLMEKYGRSNV